MLHISKDEQRERLQERLDDPAKHWKFAPGDLEVRKQWDAYQRAYSDAHRRDRHAVGALDHRAGRLQDPPQPDDRARVMKQAFEALEAALPAGDPALAGAAESSLTHGTAEETRP